MGHRNRTNTRNETLEVSYAPRQAVVDGSCDRSAAALELQHLLKPDVSAAEGVSADNFSRSFEERIQSLHAHLNGALQAPVHAEPAPLPPVPMRSTVHGANICVKKGDELVENVMKSLHDRSGAFKDVSVAVPRIASDVVDSIVTARSAAKYAEERQSGSMVSIRQAMQTGQSVERLAGESTRTQKMARIRTLLGS